MLLYNICLPVLALAPPKICILRVSVEITGPSSNPFGAGGFVTTSPLWRVHGDVWKVRGQRVFGNPGSVHYIPGATESNWWQVAKKTLLGSRSYHNTRISSWWFGKCEWLWMCLFGGLFGDGWRANMWLCLLGCCVWYFTNFGYIFWSSQPSVLISFCFPSLWLKAVDLNNCKFPILLLLDPCLAPLGHGLKKVKLKNFLVP